MRKEIRYAWMPVLGAALMYGAGKNVASNWAGQKTVEMAQNYTAKLPQTETLVWDDQTTIDLIMDTQKCLYDRAILIENGKKHPLAIMSGNIFSPGVPVSSGYSIHTNNMLDDRKFAIYSAATRELTRQNWALSAKAKDFQQIAHWQYQVPAQWGFAAAGALVGLAFAAIRPRRVQPDAPLLSPVAVGAIGGAAFGVLAMVATSVMTNNTPVAATVALPILGAVMAGYGVSRGKDNSVWIPGLAGSGTGNGPTPQPPCACATRDGRDGR